MNWIVLGGCSFAFFASSGDSQNQSREKMTTLRLDIGR